MTKKGNRLYPVVWMLFLTYLARAVKRCVEEMRMLLYTVLWRVHSPEQPGVRLVGPAAGGAAVREAAPAGRRDAGQACQDGV